MSQFRKLVLTTLGKQQNGSRMLSNKINMPIRPKLLWLKWEEDSCSQFSKTREEAVTATYYCPAKKCLTSHIRVLYLGAHILLARRSANGYIGNVKIEEIKWENLWWIYNSNTVLGFKQNMCSKRINSMYNQWSIHFTCMHCHFKSLSKYSLEKKTPRGFNYANRDKKRYWMTASCNRRHWDLRQTFIGLYSRNTNFCFLKINLKSHLK